MKVIMKAKGRRKARDKTLMRALGYLNRKRDFHLQEENHFTILITIL
jgi:hypothetical protein